jgi:iron-sulfur cluster protein
MTDTSKVSADLGPDAERPAGEPVGRHQAPSKMWTDTLAFPDAARTALRDSQLRHNLARATATIRDKRDRVVAELPDWEQLRLAGAALKDEALHNLDSYLLQVEERVTAAGGQVHWARDAAEANAIVIDLIRATGVDEVVKVKSMATQEIELNEALEEAGIAARETDLAELIVQLGKDRPSHILVPAIHRNRAEIRELFLRTMPEAPRDLSDAPRELAEAARTHLRRKFLSAKVAISGANFVVAETGTLVVVESEGNGRMCLTLPEVLISVVGIEKVVPTWRDLEVFLQLLPRSSTGERMNPYTSLWTGVTPGDGPQELHVVLLDNGRSRVLRDEVGRQALHCIRCSACLNVCPVYRQASGQILWRLGWTDEARGIVDRERHDARVPPGEVVGQVAVVLHAGTERMQFMRRRTPSRRGLLSHGLNRGIWKMSLPRGEEARILPLRLDWGQWAVLNRGIYFVDRSRSNHKLDCLVRGQLHQIHHLQIRRAQQHHHRHQG